MSPSPDFHLASAIITQLGLQVIPNLFHHTMSNIFARMLRYIPISLLVITITMPSLRAEEQAEYDMEARRQSVVNLTRHIKQREARLDELKDDLKLLDARIEKRADELVNMLGELHDSNESKIRVSQVKIRAIKGLRRWIETYKSRRAVILESLRRNGTHLPKDQLANDIDEFDKRIEKRVSQIMKLSESMGDHQDVKKYESAGGSYWNGYYHESTRVSDDWKQNRRQTVMSDKNRRELLKAVEAAIMNLESRRSGIESKLKNPSTSNTQREMWLDELGRIDGSLESRRSNLKELMEPKGSPSGSAIGRNLAHDIERLLEDASKDLSQDIHRLLKMYDEMAEERMQCFKLSENLKAREEWLEKHDN